jgi:hypothetical protein
MDRTTGRSLGTYRAELWLSPAVVGLRGHRVRELGSNSRAIAALRQRANRRQNVNVSLLLLLSSLPPRREVAHAAEKCDDQDSVVFHFVQQAILEHEELPNRWIVQLGHDAPAL